MKLLNLIVEQRATSLTSLIKTVLKEDEILNEIAKIISSVQLLQEAQEKRHSCAEVLELFNPTEGKADAAYIVAKISDNSGTATLTINNFVTKIIQACKRASLK